MPNGSENDGGQAGVIIDKGRALIRDAAILVAALGALAASIQSCYHGDKLKTIETNQADVKTETAQIKNDAAEIKTEAARTQVIAAKTLVTNTDAPADKKTLAAAENKLAEAQAATQQSK